VAERDHFDVDTDASAGHLVGKSLRDHIGDLEKRMRQAASDLEFEEAARLRDEIRRLEEQELGLPSGGTGQAKTSIIGLLPQGRREQNSRTYRGVKTGSGSRGKQARKSGR
jgi:excinuclease ABC subunit B